MSGPLSNLPGRVEPYMPWAAAAFSFAVACFHYDYGAELVDEGVLNMGAWRITEGQVPYRDFFIPYTPGSFYFLALFYKLFGVSVLTGRLAAVAVSAALTAALALLCVKAVRDPLFASVPLAISAQAGMAMWHFASHHWLGNLFTILAVLLLVRGNEGGNDRDFLLSGACAACSFLVISDQGFYTMLFPAAMLAVTGLRSKKVRPPVLFLSGGAALLAPAALYLLWKVPFSDLAYDLVVHPFTGYKQFAGNRMGILFPYGEIVAFWREGLWKGEPFYSVVVSSTSLIIAVLPVLWLPAAGWLLFKARERRFATAVLSLGALAMTLTAARRWAPINLMWAAALPSLVVALFLREFAASGGNGRRRVSRLAAACVVVLFALFGVLKVGKSMDGSMNARIESPAGTLSADKPRLVSKLNGLLLAIERLVPGDEQLLTRHVPLVNFLSLRMNPTRVDLFNPPVYTPDEQMREMIEQMESRGARFFVTPAFTPDGGCLFDAYIVEKFRVVWENGDFFIYERKPEGNHGR